MLIPKVPTATTIPCTEEVIWLNPRHCGIENSTGTEFQTDQQQ